MASNIPSLEDTISIYKSKYLIDLDDEIDDTTQHEESPDGQDGRRLNDSDEDEDIRLEKDIDDDDDESQGRVLRSRLPKDLAGLMGQANVSFARGEYADAILMCQEVIRLAPKCAEPFISLAEHYCENEEDEEKAEQLYLIAAYLQPSNTHLWVRVAESATKRREFRLAATCYTKAIRADKNESSIVYHLRRCNLYEKLGDQKKALKGYENLISILDPEDDKFGLELARGVTRIYQAENKVEACIRTLEGALEKYSHQFSTDDISQLAVCYNSTQNYKKTVDLMVQRCHVMLKVDGHYWDSSKVDEYFTGGSQPSVILKTDNRERKFDINNKCYLAVALISLKFQEDAIKPLVDSLDTIDITIYSRPLYDVAKAYFSQCIYDKAKNILFRLTSQRDSQAASVWLLYSQCLKNLNEIDEAIAGYRKVLAYEPDDYSSRLALSNLLSVQGRLTEALDVTKQPLLTERPVDVALLYQSCKLLEQAENWPDYCIAAKALLLTDMFYTQHSKEIMCMITSKSHRTRLDNLRSVQRELNLDPYIYRQKSIGPKLDSDCMLRTFLRYTQVLYHTMKDHKELIRICFSAYTCPAFECFESSIDFYSALACICAEDREFTYHQLKILAYRNPDNYQVWSLLSMSMCNIYQDLRHAKFCLRQGLKNPDILPLAIFNGHNALMSGSYKHALGEYMNVLRERPDDPLAAFCVALTFLSLSCQRYVSSKNLCLFQMIAFLHTYLELRGSCQEAMYNIGRVFHQLNMLDKAVIFYRKVLSMPCSRDKITPLNESEEEYTEIFDLRREAAFNLALIYKNSHSYRLAYLTIKDNFTI